MLTADENELLARVGAGTPMGNLLRRYWHPIAARAEMEERWTKRVRIMGEDLVLFRNRTGGLGLIGEACPHRRASLAYGIPTAEGIRCPYHGWMFDAMGQCLEQPNEPEGGTLRQAQGRPFKDKVQHTGYPVAELGGLVFAYLGPLPAPLLPRLDGYVVDPAIRIVGSAVIPCNWLQIMENTVDPVHSEWLHGHFQEFMQGDGSREIFVKRHLKIAFDEVPYGIIKRRLKEGQAEDCSDWRVGHPLVFPNILALGNAQGTWRTYEFQIRVPIDDTSTLHLWYTAFKPPAGARIPTHLLEKTYVHEVPVGVDGTYQFDMSDDQDVMAWTTQGGIADRTLEHLGTTDRGITLYRRMLLRELRKVAAGEDPMLTVRDAAQDTTLELPAEHDKAHFAAGFEAIVKRRSWRYSPIADEIVAAFRESTAAPAAEARHAPR
jgi:5,5'-dehydrodivanillate O-demethylase oxygenase subunit